jgi:uncharacterized membrane protein YedE/YeeE
MTFALVSLSLALAALLGFSVHRGSVCMVRSVAEVLSTGRAYMLLGFGKTIVWVLIATTPALWLGGVSHPGHAWAASLAALAGGFLFGVGAAINRGCAFSTLGRLGNGEVGAWFTLGGFALGAISPVAALTRLGWPQPQPVSATYDPLDPLPSALAMGLALWGVWEVARLWRTRPRGVSWRALALARTYRLSTAAALIGIANGVLYALNGPWTYTAALHGDVIQLQSGDGRPLALRLGLFFAVVTGAVVSAWQRGTLRLDWRPSPSWLQDFAGGLLMGLGAAIAPGGNDVLVLQAIPQLSPHALPAYLAMTAGIAMVLVIMRATGGARLEVDCRGDVCRTGRMAVPRRRQSAGASRARSPARATDLRARPIGLAFASRRGEAG